MIKFKGKQMVSVGEDQPALYLAYEVVVEKAWGRDISAVAKLVLVDMEKQNINIGRQAQREGQEGIFLAAHFRFNDDDVIVHRGDTAEGVRQAYLDMLQKRSDDYEASPEGVAARKKYEQEQSDKTEIAQNLLEGLMRVSFKYKNAGSTKQPVGMAAHEFMHSLYDFVRVADDINNTGWSQDIFLESMARFNYVDKEHEGNPLGFFNDLYVKRAYIVGQAINLVKQNGCFHQTLFVLLERYFRDEKASDENEKRNGGEQTDT